MFPNKRPLDLVEWLLPRLILAAATFASHAGCSTSHVADLPKTYAVEGKVVDKEGQPITQGIVEFVSVKNEKTQAIGKLSQDGTFSLTTMLGAESLPGAVEGEHKVSLLPIDRGQRPIYFRKRCNVKAGENYFELKN
ncbi:MAG: hypothetical protein WD738_06755 [Pirellulales bacterium]